MNGEKNLLNVKIDSEQLEKDDIELLEDMIVVAINDAIDQINKETENKMGKYTKGMPGLF
jgi:DNA-binding protein YbaB